MNNECPKCGKENLDDSKFCEECGILLKTSEDKMQQNDKKIIYLTVIAVIVIILAFVSYIAYANYYNSISDNNGTIKGNGITFNHPSNWITYTSDAQDPNYVVSLKTSSGNGSTLIVTKDNAYDYTFDIMHNSAINVSSNSTLGNQLISDKNITINGNPAYQIIYQSNPTEKMPIPNSSRECETIGFIYKNKEYKLHFFSDNISSIQNDIDYIVNSFKVTE